MLRDMIVTYLILPLLKGIVFLWGFHTKWIYRIFSDSRKTQNIARSKLVYSIQDSDNEATFKPCAWRKTPFMEMFEQEKFETLADIWDWSLQRYGEKKLFGTRKKDSNEKLMGKYNWISYNDTETSMTNLGQGLIALGQRRNKNICLFANSRAEWMITAQTCFKHSFPLVVIPTSVSIEGILHCLRETEVEIVITSQDLLPKFKTLIQADDVQVKTLVYIANEFEATNKIDFREDIQIVSFLNVLSSGEMSKDQNSTDRPMPENTALITYTSGSTGAPKGVLLTHKNVVAQLISSQCFLISHPEDIYIAYLPLAHNFELVLENIMMFRGVRIGYSHPGTLLDSSTLIEDGSKGDITILRPTIMICVPLVLERIYKKINENIRTKTYFVKNLIEFCIEYKKECMINGEITPIMDRLIFGNIRNILGGMVRTIISGGAPLAPKTHSFLRTVFGVSLQQGYGLSEAGCAAIMDYDDNSVGKVGCPPEGVNLKLVNWEEGNYKVTDKPFPRGEIYIGGETVAQGYLNLEHETKENFLHRDNSRWFKTGDIGQVEGDGNLRIIDRKKDIVKLQNGKYIGLGMVESVLKGCPVLANVFVFGESTKNFVVAIVCPQQNILTELGLQCGKMNMKFDALCCDEDVSKLVLNKLVDHGIQAGLQKYEIPAAVTLTPIEWTPINGFTTAAMKLKRMSIQNQYQDCIDKMYAE